MDQNKTALISCPILILIVMSSFPTLCPMKCAAKQNFEEEKQWNVRSILGFISFLEKVFRTLSWCDFLWAAREANRAVQKQSKMTMLDRSWQGTQTFKAQQKCKPERHFASAQKPSVYSGVFHPKLDMQRIIVKSGIWTLSWDLVCRLRVYRRPSE